MKTENMKLLDLQTGKYLELEKDWLYGGEYIRRIDREKELYNDINNEKKELTTLLENYFAGKKLSVSEACVIDNLKKGKQSSANANVDRFLQSEVFCVKKQPHTDTLINTICGTTGAVVYGGRYVLFLDQEIGSVYNIKNEYRREEFIDYKCKNGDFSSGYNFYNNDIMTFLGNIFEEYSKQLRNEPNKFDELNELLK